MSIERYIKQFDLNSKFGALKKKIIGTAEITEIIANEYFPNNRSRINKLHIDELVKSFKNTTNHITKRIFLEMMQYLDIYIKRWGEFDEDIITCMIFKGLDSNNIGKIESRNGIIDNFTMYLQRRFYTISKNEASERIKKIIYKLKPRYYGERFQKEDTFKTGLSKQKCSLLLQDLFEIESSLNVYLNVFLGMIVVNNCISLKTFLIICQSLEWIIERTGHLTILELLTMIYIVFDSNNKAEIPKEKCVQFFELVKLNACNKKLPMTVKLFDFLKAIEDQVDLVVDVNTYWRYVDSPIIKIKTLPIIQKTKITFGIPLLNSLNENKTEFIKNMLRKLKVNWNLIDRLLYVYEPERRSIEEINTIAKMFNSNILSYGINEGFLRSTYSLFEVNGIDNESLVKISIIFNSPITMEIADKVITAYVEDGSGQLNMNGFLRYWLDTDTPSPYDSDDEKEVKLLKRIISIYRLLEKDGFVSKDDIISFMEEQYGELSIEYI